MVVNCEFYYFNAIGNVEDKFSFYLYFHVMNLLKVKTKVRREAIKFGMTLADM